MKWLAWAGAFCAIVGAAIAGGGPLNTIVVVNGADTQSLEIGRRYAWERGIPESHILQLYAPTSGTVGIGIWSNQIRNPVLSFINAQGLSNQIDYVVFAHAFPYRIWNTNIIASPTNWLVASLTSSMYYDFFASSNAFAYGCHLNSAASNAYYKAERAFRRSSTPNGRYLISALLTAYTPDETRLALRRSAASDFTQPSGRIDLVRTSDGLRSARWPQHEEADYRARLHGRKNEWFIRVFDPIPSATNLMGYQTGRDVVYDLFSHQYLSGSYADHLTSYGGILDEPHPHTRILEWIRAGAAGSYGTVVEPCAYTEKFPDALIYHWYERGFSLGESLYMSVSHPYQGLFVGDPLTAPYAKPSTVTVLSPTNGTIVSGVVTVVVEAVSADASRPISQIDLFIEGRRHATIFDMQPTPLNMLNLQLPDGLATKPVLPGEDLFQCAQGLAVAANLVSTKVNARTLGDTVELSWAALGESATNEAISAWTTQGLATALTISAWAVQTNFMDPPYSAHEVLVLRGNAVSGDVVRAVITLTNGVVATNVAVASAPMGALFLLFQLQGVINSNALLQGPDGVAAVYLVNGNPTYAELVLAARTPGVGGTGIHVDYSIQKKSGSTLVLSDAFQDYFNDNADTMRPRALVRLAVGVTSRVESALLDTTPFPNGPLRLDFVAYEGTATRVQGRATLALMVSNSPYMCAVQSPPAYRHVLRGSVVTCEAVAVNGAGTTTQVAFFVAGKLAAVDTTPPFVFEWNTATALVGLVHIQALARTDAGEAARSELLPVMVYIDEDGDELSDLWEIDHFGSATNANALGDPDGDGSSNLDEFIAGTIPTNGLSRFALISIQPPMVGFSAGTNRVYRVEYTDGMTLEPWEGAFLEIVGTSETLFWHDDPTNAPPASGPMRAYRVRARLP
ncbi:MAG: TIGR03790 family protein [Kiritimatiellae bacterium]|nr:TIGR03790 family protein [Kiritimatiellia bacterium]MDW8458519.1 TIGR03790 family protein [Verrucomicrobiota bacterium]